MSDTVEGDRPFTEEERLRVFGPRGEKPMTADDQIPSFLKSVSSARAMILDTAREAVTKDRAATHGALEASFGQIAAIWSVRLGVTVTPAQVSILMIDLKTVRAWNNAGHLDNWVDMAGYAACGGELAASGGEA